MTVENEDAAQRRSIREESRELFRDGIQEAATKVFARLGYDGARMVDIAAEAGVAAGTLYNYFESKDAIFQLILSREAADLDRRLREAVTTGDGPGKLRAIIDVSLTFIEPRGGIFTVYAQQGGQDLFRRMNEPNLEVEFAASLHALIRQVVADAVAAGQLRQDVDAEVIAAALAGCLNRVVSAWAVDGCPPGLAGKSTAIHDLFLSGALPR